MTCGMTRVAQATRETIEKAAALLQSGELVVFPTETVYGLGADARNSNAVAKIYALKQRPAHNPLIVHVASLEQAETYAVFDARARSVAAALWPGPITLVLPLRPESGLAPQVTAGLGTIAVRVPAHPVAMGVITASGCPLAAPSANPSGQLSPTTPGHVAHSLGEGVSLVLAAGKTAIGLESTVLDLTSAQAKILRPGAIGPEELQALIGDVVFGAASEAIKAPGQLKKHYSPRTKIRLNAVDVKEGEAFLGFGNMNFIGAEGAGFVKDMKPAFWRNLSPEGDLHEAATHLYAYLHELDEAGASMIAVQRIPDTGLGVAINDRLTRASS